MSHLLYISIFLSALVSGWHCAIMCGGVASWVESKVIRMVSPRKIWVEQFVMHIARIMMYMLLGGIAGYFGAFVWQQNALPLQRFMFLLASILLIFQGYFLIFGSKVASKRQFRLGLGGIFDYLEKRLAVNWAKLSSRQTASLSSNNWIKRIAMGLLWGLIPCGLVYSVLPLAFLSGSFSSGALLMGAMGLGTLPNLLIISGFVGRVAAHLVQAGHAVWMRWVAGGLMLLTGLLGLYHAFTLSDTFLKAGFCFS